MCICITVIEYVSGSTEVFVNFALVKVKNESTFNLFSIIAEDSLRSLDSMADEIEKELVPLQRVYESKNKHLLLLWILLVLVSLAVSVLMVLPSVYNGLSSCYLQVLCSLIPSASWMISLFIFFHTLDSVHMMRGMIANYRQVNLLIDHNRNKQKRNNY